MDGIVSGFVGLDDFGSNIQPHMTNPDGAQLSVDLAKIIQRKSEDVRLMPSDILYIPDNKAKVAFIRAAEIGITIGTALTIYRLGTR